MKSNNALLLIFCVIFGMSFFQQVSAAWEDRTNPTWWPVATHGWWDGSKWNYCCPAEIVIHSDPGDNNGVLQGSRLAGERPTKARLTFSGGPAPQFSIRNVG